MEVEGASTGLDAEKRNCSVSHEESYEDRRDWDVNENEDKSTKEEGFCDDGPDAELDYDEENRESEHASFLGEDDQESVQNDDACEVSDDDPNGDEGRESDEGQGDLRNSVDNISSDEDDKMKLEPTVQTSRSQREPSEEGEIDDLEDGELRSDGDSDGEQKEPERAPVEDKERGVKVKESKQTPIRVRDDEDMDNIPNVCKFYLRGNCTWGLDCKYVHPREANRERRPSGSRPRNAGWAPGDRDRGSDRPSIHSRVTYPGNTSEKADAVGSRGGAEESAWERGLRQARELMKKATKKKEEEPDFEKKRLVLAPSEEVDRRTTDDDSDDSRAMNKGDNRGGLSPRRNVRPGGPANASGDIRSRNPRRYDRFEAGGANDGPSNLGPQVLYPNGRPNNRRHDGNGRRNNKREMPINERYYVPRHPSRSPRSVSRSPSPRRGPLPVSRSGSEKSGPTRKQRNLGASVSVSGGGSNIRDPWDRSQRKRNRSRELPPTTLGAVLQKARESEERSHSRKRLHSTSVSESSATESSSSSTSRSSSSDRRRKAATRASLAAAVPLKSLFDDDGSIRQTDLSSFRIPKKKRPSRSPSRPTAVLKKPAAKAYASRDEVQLHADVHASHSRRPGNLSPPRNAQQSQKGLKSFRNNDAARYERRLSEAKENISSEESSSSSSSSSSSDDDAEPAAYRRKRKSQTDDDGLPTEGIPLSPEADAEDVSSEEDERSPSPKKSTSRSRSRSTPERHASASPSHVENDRRHGSDSDHHEEAYAEGHLDEADDYVDDEAEKEERRAELLRQLKYVEDAIARKRNRPVA